ncbi:hypothetical protein GCK32_022288 [Trichostrongylus colubriformis]|uniref:Uncharacterized protein n=1 Tax=Trichostrongylus colubriformis TaxID=6319 RepID=A0AAN8FCC9_TRICO
MGNAKSADFKEEPIKRKPKSNLTERKPSSVSREKKLSRASMSSQCGRKPILTLGQRAIIKYCIDNAKDDIGGNSPFDDLTVNKYSEKTIK